MNGAHLKYAFALYVLLSAHSLARETLNYKSPNSKWSLIADWISDTYGYEWFIQDVSTKKHYFGLSAPPAGNEIGSRYVSAIWSPDSHYVAVSNVIGRAISETVLIATEPRQPRDYAFPPDIGQETFEVSLLKEKDKKRFTGRTHLWVSPDKWLNNTDILISADMTADLKPSRTEPAEQVNVVALIAFRLGGHGKARIIRGNYERYERRALAE